MSQIDRGRVGRSGVRRRSGRRDIVVFSGGGPLGAAQAGALVELMDAGVTPAAVVGCSVGALNAAFLAYDPTPDRARDLVSLWHSLRTADVFPGSMVTKVRNLLVHRDRLFDNGCLRALVRRGFPAGDLSDSAIPLHVVTTDLVAGRAVFHSRGDAETILTASAAIPGVFPPVRIGDRLHVDGGVTTLLPIRYGLTLGDHVWAIDATGPSSCGLRPSLRALDLVGLAFSIAMRTQPDREMAAGHRHVTLISPDCASSRATRSPFALDSTVALIEAGRRAARLALASHRCAA